MFGSLGSKRIPIITNVSFGLVVAGSAISIFGLLDAFLAADLLVFNALGNLHAAVVGLFMSIIGAAGLAEALMDNGETQQAIETGPVPVEINSSINLQLDAERVQAMLHVLRYPIYIDGDFGPITEGVVREFQLHNGLEPNGIVGSLTLEALQKQVEAYGRTDWVMQILREINSPALPQAAPILSLVSAPRAI
jgi:peptidoglycan hydrolase-like protein with peptidoglycan-binding domain